MCIIIIKARSHLKELTCTHRGIPTDFEHDSETDLSQQMVRSKCHEWYVHNQGVSRDVNAMNVIVHFRVYIKRSWCRPKL